MRNVLKRVTAVLVMAIVMIMMTFAMICADTFAASQPVKGRVTASVENRNSVTLKWDKVKKAAKYKVYRKKADGKYVLVKTTSQRTYKNQKLSYGTKYTFKVTALSESGKKLYSKTKTIHTKAKKPVKVPMASSITLEDVKNEREKTEGKEVPQGFNPTDQKEEQPLVKEIYPQKAASSITLDELMDSYPIQGVYLPPGTMHIRYISEWCAMCTPAEVKTAVYKDRDCSEIVEVETVSLNCDASIHLPAGTYYVKKTEVPAGYVLENTVYAVTVTAGEETFVIMR